MRAALELTPTSAFFTSTTSRPASVPSRHSQRWPWRYAPLGLTRRASYRRAGGSTGSGSAGMSLARRALPAGALALAAAAAPSRCLRRFVALAHRGAAWAEAVARRGFRPE